MFSTKPWLASLNNTLVFFPWLHELDYNEITWVKLCVASKRPSVFPPKGTTDNKKADPSWTLLFSEKVIKTTWKCWHFKRQVCILMTSTSTRNVCGHWMWSRDMKQLCWRESDPSFLISELCKDRRSLLLLFFLMQSLPLLYTVPTCSQWKFKHTEAVHFSLLVFLFV